MSFRLARRGNADCERGGSECFVARCLVVGRCRRGTMGLLVFSAAVEDAPGQLTEPESDCR